MREHAPPILAASLGVKSIASSADCLAGCCEHYHTDPKMLLTYISIL